LLVHLCLIFGKEEDFWIAYRLKGMDAELLGSFFFVCICEILYFYLANFIFVKVQCQLLAVLSVSQIRLGEMKLLQFRPKFDETQILLSGT